MAWRSGAAVACIAALLFIPGPGRATELHAFAGATFDARTPLTISQDGWPDLRFTARYDSRSFERPLYWAVRVIQDVRGRSWALDFVHQKLFLANPPPEVQRFAISHGFNLLTVGRLWPVRGFTALTGGGILIAHPENEVRGMPLDEGGRPGGYVVTGPVLAVGLGRSLRVHDRFFVSIEGRATVARAHVPVADGEARFTNAALHGLGGLGVRF